METKASHVIIGAFTLLAILAGLGFFLWLARVEINQRFTRYDILFDQVSGLGESSPVRFNGVDVGEVVAIALDRANPSLVRVRIEVAASTPVRQGTEATLSTQGVTGVTFVGLEGGLPDAARLPIDPEFGVARIPSKTTPVQSLLEDAPDVLKQTQVVLDGIGRFTTQDNADHVTQILANLEDSSERLTRMMADLSETSDSLTAAADRFAAFSQGLEGVTGNANGAITDARAAIADLRKAVADARTALGHIDNFAAEGLPQIADLSGPVARLVADLSRLTDDIRRDPARFLLGNRPPEYNR